MSVESVAGSGQLAPAAIQWGVALPKDIWLLIAQHLQVSDALSLRQVAKKFSEDDYVVKVLDGNKQLNVSIAKKILTCEAPLQNKIFNNLTKDSVREFDYPNYAPSAEGLKRMATHFPNIEKLTLRNLPDDAAASLVFFRKLKCLCLACAYLTEEVMQRLPTSLEELTINGCAFTDEAMTPLSRLTQLKKLHIDSNRFISGSSFASLPASLQELSCHSCQLTDEAMSNLAHLTQLQSLCVDFNEQLTGSTFNFLPPSLKRLHCNSCALTDEALSNHLEHLTELQDFSIDQNLNVTGTQFLYLPSSLEVLSVKLCKRLTDEALAHLKPLEKLHTLYLNNNKLVTGKTFRNLPLSLRAMYCVGSSITDEAIMHLQRLSGLETLILNFKDNDALTCNTFNFLPASLKVLCCWGKYTDTTLAHFAHLTQLQELDISHNKAITGKSFNLLPPSLRKFTGSGCSLTNTAMTNLASSLTELQALCIAFNESPVPLGFDLRQLPLSLRSFDCRFSPLTDEARSHIAALRERGVRVEV